MVGQKFTSYSINAVFLLTVGAGVLALHTSGDRPAGESKREYYTGFFLTLLAAALYGFVLPLVELTYKKAKQAVTYTLVLEIQLVMCFFATVVCAVGMLINRDFQVSLFFFFFLDYLFNASGVLPTIYITRNFVIDSLSITFCWEIRQEIIHIR